MIPRRLDAMATDIGTSWHRTEDIGSSALYAPTLAKLWRISAAPGEAAWAREKRKGIFLTRERRFVGGLPRGDDR